MATGLGKTWLAAFDAARPEVNRVLFVAHREEILKQSRDVFRRVIPDATMGLYHGGEKKSPNAAFVFASVQTLSRNLDHFASDAFDYIAVDEFHHAAAETYRKVLDHFSADFLLGLTATPERMDGGGSPVALCGQPGVPMRFGRGHSPQRTSAVPVLGASPPTLSTSNQSPPGATGASTPRCVGSGRRNSGARPGRFRRVAITVRIADIGVLCDEASRGFHE